MKGVAYGENKQNTTPERRPDCVTEIRMGNTCNLFRKGSRIRLDISGSAFPKYDRNHQVAARVGSTSRWQTARDMLYFGAETPSCLILTVQNPDGKG